MIAAPRPPTDLVHLQTAACGRSSLTTMAAVADHLILEATEGGYAAEEAVQGTVERLRVDLGAMLGTDAGGVALVEGATAGLLALLRAWPLPTGATVAVTPSEWGPNLDAFARHGLIPATLTVDDDGVLDLDALETTLRDRPPALVHLVHLASHRSLVQPVTEALARCRAHGVPLWVDAAQSLGHLGTGFGADAAYAPGRKWLAGPRGVGVVAVGVESRGRLDPFRPAMRQGESDIRLLESAEAYVAGRVGLATAVREHLAAGPEAVHLRLAERGERVRQEVVAVAGWEVADVPGVGSAIVGLRSTTGQDVSEVQQRLLSEHRILTSTCLPWRAPSDMEGPLLRLSPWAGTGDQEIEALARAL